VNRPVEEHRPRDDDQGVYQVALIPPPEALGQIELFRRLHDPAFHRLPAHVPLLPPFEPIRRDVLTQFDALRAAPFDARLGNAHAMGTSLMLDLVLGAGETVALRGTLHAALLDPAAPEVDSAPRVRIGHFASDAALELARRGLGPDEELQPFRVDRVTLLLEDVRGIWHPVRERVLRAPAA
jgi:hypothetical protein